METQKNKQETSNTKVQPAKTTKINEQFKYLLKNNSKEELIEELKNVAPGIETGYKIGNIDLAFPGGALSIVAAPTSHGKTTALINFALGVLEGNTKKNIYFFSYEEGASSIKISFLNSWTSKEMLKISKNTPPLSKNNKRSIESYLRGTDEFIKEENRYDFQRNEEAFFTTLIDSGRLKVFYSDMKADELVEAIRFIKDNDKNVGIIYIDYMQLLKAEKPRSSRQEELKQICLMFKDISIETGLPIVLAAQFNRTVVSEEDLSPISIGEAGDIERVASLIIGMFNRNFDKMSKSGNVAKDGSKIQKESAIYFEILKGRNIGNGHACVMEFDGNKGLVLNRTSEVNTKDSF